MAEPDAPLPVARTLVRPVLAVVGLLLLLATAVAVRSLGHAAVFRPEGVQFFGNDAYYHMRRIALALEHGEVPGHDPLLHHPDGATAIWPPAFDATVALVLRVLGVERIEDAERIAAWLPVVLAALAVLGTVLAARALSLGAAGGAVAGFLVAVLPGHVYRSHLGYLDHHCVLPLLTLAVALVAAACVRARSRSALGIAALLQGVVLAAAVAVWPGCLLLCALWALAVPCLAVTGPAEERRRFVAIGGALCFAVAAFVLQGFVVLSQTPAEPSWVLLSPAHPALLFAIALAFAGTALFVRRSALSFLLVPGIFFAGLAGFAVLVRPPVRLAAAEAVRWLTKDEEFQASVTESAPLFARGVELAATAGVRDLSFAVLAAPVLLLLLLVHALRRRQRGALFLALAVVVLGLPTLLQQRFVDFSTVAFALLLGSTTARFVALARTRGQSVVLWILVLGAAGLALEPSSRPIRGAYARLRAKGADGRPLDSLQESEQAERIAVARWIRENTPPTRGFDPPQGPVEYGVLAPWSAGHVLQYVGRRACVVDNFGDDLGGEHFADVQRFLASTDLAQAEEILQRYRVGLVVTEPPGSLAELGGRRLDVRLHFFGGSALDTPSGESLEHVPFLRLVHESRLLAVGALRLPPQRVFEVVPGAVLVGDAAPGATVIARLHLKTNLGRPVTAELGERLPFEARTKAGADGRFHLRFPYSTERGGTQAEAAGPVQLFNGTRRVTLEVPERAVREGTEVPVPGLSP